MKFTILGSKGFIGSHLVKSLEKKEISCFAPDLRKQDILQENLGHIIYSLGVSDFIQRPYDAVDAHVCIVRKILEKGHFDSFLYLSSGRIYYNGTSTEEEDNIIINPLQQNDLYNISKAMGESICISSKKENIRIVRPSNVTGNNFSSNLFIPSILRDAVDNRKIFLRSTLDSEKDYVHIDDVVHLLPEIAVKGKQQVYNIAFGKNITNQEIVNEISRLTDCEVEVQSQASKFSFPTISIKRIKNEFGFLPTPIIPRLEEMVKAYSYFKKN